MKDNIVSEHLVKTACRKKLLFPQKRGICAPNIWALWNWMKCAIYASKSHFSHTQKFFWFNFFFIIFFFNFFCWFFFSNFSKFSQFSKFSKFSKKKILNFFWIFFLDRRSRSPMDLLLSVRQSSVCLSLFISETPLTNS